ncbi:helix-turn-helix transcriptional regulator [Mesorhizobium sp. B2-3-12]|uniref:helix-turn-helix transcriptional regulator n=1 Tax=Mesorhizobium sp. B2-3-12 TaxID=2589952 RepID=UPI0011262206|nr:helix-turn-helix transcriptional regulator [Mesorhizobium sp. B2-3-12]TPL88580.1 helix-turn-helix transcriptional regulator [Mesorhizobium sp. B2-3-12]
MFDDLTDEIYEAAFIPDLWAGVLEAASGILSLVSGSIFVISDSSPTRGRISDNSLGHNAAYDQIRPLFEEFLIGHNWKMSPGVMRMYDMNPSSFVHVEAFMSEEEIEQDAVRMRLRAAGIGAHLCSAVSMPTGELVTFVFQRWTDQGIPDQASVDRLNLLRPHFARAGLVSARLGMEQAKATVSALDAIGLPAAVLTASGRTLTTNALLEDMGSVVLATAQGGMALTNTVANALFQEAITHNRHSQVVRSIPIPAKEEEPGLVIHLVPLRRAAHDIFSGGDILVAATAVSASNMVPSPSVLNGLFDLTPAEARLAATLTSGKSLKQTALICGIQPTTARYYLEQIFRKTGTSQQSQLVALLKSATPLGRQR